MLQVAFGQGIRKSLLFQMISRPVPSHLSHLFYFFVMVFGQPFICSLLFACICLVNYGMQKQRANPTNESKTHAKN
jgi:hypothetical protein